MGESSKTNSEHASSLQNYGFVAMVVTHTLTHVFEGIHTAIFSILREEFTLSLQQLGFIASIPPLIQALFAIPMGVFSDRFGPKRLLLVSFIVAGLGAILASQATGPLMLVVAVTFIYLNTTIYHPASYSFTTKLFRARHRSKAMGLHGAGGTLGHATGPLLVSVLIGFMAWPWRNVYLFLALPMFLGFIIVLFLKDETIVTVEEKSTRMDEGHKDIDTLITKRLVMFLIFSALGIMGSSIIGSFLVLYLQDVRGMSIAYASLIVSTSGLIGIVAAPIGGYMATKFGDKKWILISRGGGWVCLTLSLLIQNLTLFAMLYITYGFCVRMSMAARSSIIAKISPRRQRGLGYALFFLPTYILRAVAPITAGYFADIYGFNNIFYIALMIYLASLGILKYKVNI